MAALRCEPHLATRNRFRNHTLVGYVPSICDERRVAKFYGPTTSQTAIDEVPFINRPDQKAWESVTGRNIALIA
jgi:hypothetical protein